MQKDIYKKKLQYYWRNIDKKILFSFVLLFFLGLFFSFSSTSFLAGERLNKNYYFFFSKHLIYSSISLFLMFFISCIEMKLLKKTIMPIFIFLFILLRVTKVVKFLFF